MPNNNGFSLMELMIAVAIVGILSALAVPAYQNYTIRAKVSEALQLGAAAKFSVSEYYVSEGELPEDMDAAGISSIATEYVASIAYSKVSDEDRGQITLTTASDLGPEEANGKELILEASIDDEILKWRCFAPDGDDGLSAKHLPANCR